MRKFISIIAALLLSLVISQYAVADTAQYKNTQKQIDCLAENIYFEARGEPYKGQVAVAMVTMNRVEAGRFKDDVCGVVEQKTVYKSNVVCQFSWLCDGNIKRISASKPLPPARLKIYRQIRMVAEHVYNNYGEIFDPTYGALFFHAEYVNPRWKNVRHTITIGNHIFYADL